MWGRDDTGKGTSGSGSTLEITREYRAYVEDFMKKHAVKSVVDAGCGDWSSRARWTGATRATSELTSPRTSSMPTARSTRETRSGFRWATSPEELPAADLLISKDVLQHLSNGLVQKFIENNLKKGKYKWVILTNDRGSGNPDVEPGGYRAIDLAAPPFEVGGLVDLPIKFGKETTKITSLLDFTGK
jgi:hypothetical protein